MTQIVVSMVVIVLVAGVVTAYVAFPHRGEDLPGAPWLGRLMQRGARSLPTLEPEQTDVVPTDGRSASSGESPVRTQRGRPGESGLGPVPGSGPGQHRA
jgi:hypothetical protein